MSILDLQSLQDPRADRDQRGGTSNLSVTLCETSNVSVTLCG